MEEFITNARPATLSEKAYSLAEREHRNWYLVERGEEIGITPELLPTDDLMSTYEPESLNGN